MLEKIIIVILKMDIDEKDKKMFLPPENISVSNIIEIEKIKKILENQPDLLSFFQVMCEVVNEKINDE
jgi:hypothetical protein